MSELMEIDRIKIDDVVYYRLYVRCPECLEQGRHVNQDFWTHADCGGDIYIGDNAHFFCNRCKTTVPILNCSYECPNHSRMKNDCLIRTNPSRRNHYDVHSRVIVQFVRYAGIPWLRRLIENFEKSKCLYG